MQSGDDGKPQAKQTVADLPKSFAPEQRDPAVESAWDRLDQLSKPPQRRSGTDAELIRIAQSIIEARAQRRALLPESMFGEPAWDMLLTLYVDRGSGAGERVSNLGLSSGTPATTALRWIDFLEREAFVTRRSSATDKRVVFVELTDKGNDVVRAYMIKLIERGIAPGWQA